MDYEILSYPIDKELEEDITINRAECLRNGIINKIKNPRF